jgi:L-ascorbate metabolism protein UlaG (beta-lactamase superfamily)
MKSFGKPPQGERLERLQASPLWTPQGLRNRHPVLPGLRDTTGPRPSLGDFLCGGERRVPSGPLPSMDPHEAWRRPAASGLRATWLGHSTVLIEIGGKRVLTDPVWGPRASPSRLVGPKRFQPMPVALKALPPIDLVVISHDHYDHLDYPTIRALAKVGVPFVTALGVGAHLESWGIPPERITELDWWQAEQHAGVTVTATPSQHFSGRTLSDRNSTLWASWVLQTGGQRIFYSGDSGYFPGFKTIGDTLGPMDVALMENGAYDAYWPSVHMTPEETVQAFVDVRGQLLYSVHNSTFALAMHAWREPLDRLSALTAQRGLALATPEIGEVLTVGQPRENALWWQGLR